MTWLTQACNCVTEFASRLRSARGRELDAQINPYWARRMAREGIAKAMRPGWAAIYLRRQFSALIPNSLMSGHHFSI